VNINRINPPSWAHPSRVRSDGVSSEVLARLQAAREALLSAVHTEVSAYLSDPQLVFDSADDFPSRRRLTGDYYLGDHHYDVDPETGRCRISVMARFLAHPLPTQSHPEDYLGLEVWLYFIPDSQGFSVCRNTDSSVI
jgi:hypothetical protein